MPSPIPASPIVSPAAVQTRPLTNRWLAAGGTGLASIWVFLWLAVWFDVLGPLAAFLNQVGE